MQLWIYLSPLLIIQALADSVNTVTPQALTDKSANLKPTHTEYVNEGTRYQIVIQKKEDYGLSDDKSFQGDTEPDHNDEIFDKLTHELDSNFRQELIASLVSQNALHMSHKEDIAAALPANAYRDTDNSPKQVAHLSEAGQHDEPPPLDIGGFNLDGILDLMVGDDNGNVDFGAIGIELAHNLANVIDMNEVGNMASTLGMMMSGIGVAAELQRQAASNTGEGNQNTPLDDGITMLMRQVLQNQQGASAINSNMFEPQSGGRKEATGNNNALDMSQLINLVASGTNNNMDVQGIANILGGIMSPDSQVDGHVSTRAKRNSEPASAETIHAAPSKGTSPRGEVRNVGSIMNEFVNGGDISGVSNIAQALGIRNFFKAEDKKIPEGCPSCFNCLYPGSSCAHNATCNQFTGRCDCPSGWTGEDCMQPACLSPLDGDKRPAAKSGHCHQDTECRPGWGGWNCNMCLTDSACDALNPTGEGGRCYNGSELITNVVGQCYIGNADLGRYLPDGVTPKMTFGCDRNSSSCTAQFWMSGKESFYCDLDQCNIGTWGSKSTAAIDCKRMKCQCIPGRFMCGNYGLDIASVLHEVEGPVDIKCHDDGFSNCFIREFMISKTLAAIIGDDAINMKCTVGQCVHYSQLPDYKKTVAEPSKGSMLLGASTSLLSVFVVLGIIKRLVQAQERFGAFSHRQPASHSLANSDTKPDPAELDNANNAASISQETTDEISSMMMSTLRTTVSFRNISYTIPTQGPDLVSLKSLGINIGDGWLERSPTLSHINSSADQRDMQSIQVLKNISGVVHPGEILAILGASGAGKSTLLDILSRREKCGVVTGKVQINDMDIINGITPDKFHRLSGYVDQQDLHVSTATVYETVMTSALLRLPHVMSHAAKEERVRQVLHDLGLWSVRRSKIGKVGARGISGGEMRRVSIACELVTSPSIIFLDEPTSGLDAYNAFVVMDTLSKLARKYGRTVICTIHQPRTDIFSMFDQLIVLAAGQMCYSGPASNISQYLDSIGHPVPDGYNIADFSIDLVQQATVSSSRVHTDTQQNGDLSADMDKCIDSDNNADDDEWSSILKTSSISLDGMAKEKVDSITRFPTGKAKKLPTSQFIVYNADVSLQQVLDSFATSSQREEIMKELDEITGHEWTPSPFDQVSSIGGVPHMRPVTPFQQVVVIVRNIYDLGTLLYRRICGQHTGSMQSRDSLRPPLYDQFKVLSARIFRHLYRDPTLMLANYAMSVFIGLMCGVLFYQLDNSVQGVQNRLGLLMFILAFYGFGSTTSLLVFSEERLLYLRERANAYYDPMAYFMAKITFDLIPLRVVPPMLLTLIMYPMTGLAATWHQFVKFFSTLVLFNLTTASQMFFIGLLAEQLVVSNFLASLVLLFSLLFGGLILNKESIPALLQPLFGTSSFNLAYEALAINELRYAHIEEVRFGLEIEVPTAALISSFGFNLQAFWPDISIMLVVLVASLGMSLLWLTYVIKERR